MAEPIPEATQMPMQEPEPVKEQEQEPVQEQEQEPVKEQEQEPVQEQEQEPVQEQEQEPVKEQEQEPEKEQEQEPVKEQEQERVITFCASREENIDDSTLLDDFNAYLATGSVKEEVAFRLKYQVVAIVANETTVTLYTAGGCDRAKGPKQRMCETCGKWGDIQRCSLCKYARYCSKACQEVAWPDHKLYCDAYLA